MNKEWAEKHFTYNPETGVVRRRKVTRGEGIGWIDDLGYVRFYVEGYCYRAHNIAWVLMTGNWVEVDHRDCDRQNNKFLNLRAATSTQNKANTKLRSDNNLGVKGVSFCQQTRRYRADIRKDGKRYNLGRYMTVEEAKAVYDKKAVELFGEFARL